MSMSERDFQRAVIDTAQTFSWRCAHFRTAYQPGKRQWLTPVAGDGKGFPDLVLVHPDRGLCLYRELKSADGTLTPEQQMWGTWLMDAGQNWDVWRPADMPTIVALLSGDRATVL